MGGEWECEQTTSKFVRFLLDCHRSLNLVTKLLKRLLIGTIKQIIRHNRSTKRLDEINAPGLKAEHQREQTAWLCRCLYLWTLQ